MNTEDDFLGFVAETIRVFGPTCRLCWLKLPNHPTVELRTDEGYANSIPFRGDPDWKPPPRRRFWERNPARPTQRGS